MNKFTKLIGDNSSKTLQRRAEIAQQNVVNTLKQVKCELEMKIARLTDFAPETSDSLRPGDKDWDAANWANDLQKAKQDLYFTNIQLKIAEDTYKEYFTDGE